MGAEQDSTYYDRIYTGTPRASWKNYGKARQRLFKAAAGLIPKDTSLVVDLGCGPGLFAQCLSEINPVGMYYGLDFSRVAIRQARELGVSMVCQFSVADLTKLDTEPGQPIPPDAHFVCMETLEHVEDDGHILDLVPAGRPVVVSVPQFDDPGHVRHFLKWEDVVARYGDKLEIGSHQVIWKWFIFKAIRKNEKEI